MNFGIVYGISAFSLSQDIGVTVAEAKAYMEAYFATFPGVRTYMDAIVERAREQGYVETLFHRRRDLPELKSSNFNLRSFGERVALNMPIQGTAADIMKLAMVAVHRRLKAELPAARLVLQVHDELIVECPETEAEQQGGDVHIRRHAVPAGHVPVVVLKVWAPGPRAVINLLKSHQPLASSQLRPQWASAVRGTERVTTRSISSFKSAAARSASVSGHSTISSSWT